MWERMKKNFEADLKVFFFRGGVESGSFNLDG